MKKCNVGADAPSLSGTKTECLSGEEGFSALSLTCYCLYYVVFGLVLARPYPNKLIWFQACGSFVVEWKQNYRCMMAQHYHSKICKFSGRKE